jgi:C4-type Zn-finger protein
MREATKKILKILKRTCPDCGAFLVLMQYDISHGGIIYNEQHIECECGYKEHNNYLTHKRKDLSIEF